MPIDINSVQIGDEPIEGLSEDQSKWVPPSEFPKLPRGQRAYEFKVANIREVSTLNTANGPRLNVTLDLEIVGGDHDGRKVNFQRLSNVEFQTQDRGRTSFLLDFIMSSGKRPDLRTNKDFLLTLNSMESQGIIVRGWFDWEGMCMPCFDESIVAATGAGDRASALAMASKQQKKDARKDAVKAKNYAEFPPDPHKSGERLEFFECPTCGGEIRAQGKITRWLQR